MIFVKTYEGYVFRQTFRHIFYNKKYIAWFDNTKNKLGPAYIGANETIFSNYYFKLELIRKLFSNV